MRTTWKTVALVASAATVLGLGACGGGQPAAPPDPAAAARQRVIDDADAPCVSDPGRLVVIENAKHDLTAAWQTGQGDTGVVLLHQVDGGICQWSAFAQLLVEKGHRALSVDVDSATRSSSPRPPSPTCVRRGPSGSSSSARPAAAPSPWPPPPA
ncbi:hypothetical protein ACFQZ4_41865 [Catellatospora coxensis]